MSNFLSGAIVLLCAVAALFFFRFRRQTHDRLFGLFGGAFSLLALNFALLAFVSRESEFRPYLYLIRLAAFLLIIAAIVDKNRKTAAS
ncbi:MAG: DUF5985 family protein [Actinomycetota bacterium]